MSGRPLKHTKHILSLKTYRQIYSAIKNPFLLPKIFFNSPECRTVNAVLYFFYVRYVISRWMGNALGPEPLAENWWSSLFIFCLITSRVRRYSHWMRRNFNRRYKRYIFSGVYEYKSNLLRISSYFLHHSRHVAWNNIHSTSTCSLRPTKKNIEFAEFRRRVLLSCLLHSNSNPIVALNVGI